VTGSDYHGVVNGVPGDRFTFYTTVSNSELSDEAFFARAKKRSCTIMAAGRIACLDGETAPAFTPQPPAGGGAQLDVTYVDQVYVQQLINPDTGYWDFCGPSSLAMVLHYLHYPTRASFDERQTTRSLTDVQNESGKTKWDDAAKRLRLAGLDAEYIEGAMSAEAIEQSLRDGYPIILGLNGHLTVLTGIDGSGDFIMNDPYGGKDMSRFREPRSRPRKIRNGPAMACATTTPAFWRMDLGASSKSEGGLPAHPRPSAPWRAQPHATPGVRP